VDQETLVSGQASDGRRLLAELAAKGFDVVAAGWVKTTDDGQPYLYIVPGVAIDSPWDGYQAIQPVLRSLPDVQLRLTDIKVIRPDEPLARGIVWVARRFSGPHPTWYRGTDLGGVPIDGMAYIYPAAPAPASAGS
jgi:hypothetical protein